MVTDRSLVKALIDKKSSIYSDRPASYVSHDLITRGDHTLVMNQGDKWRLFRKLMHQQFNEGKCEKQHIVLQNAEAVQMLRDFLMEPENLMQHPKRFSNSIIMSLGEYFPLRQIEPKYCPGKKAHDDSGWNPKPNHPSATPGAALQAYGGMVESNGDRSNTSRRYPPDPEICA